MTATTSTTLRPATTPATVTFVGAGPGDPGLLTLRAAEALSRADVVILDQLARENVVGRHCPQDVEIIDAGHGDHGQPLTHAANAKLVVTTAKSHRGCTVVRLMDGDPATFNGLAEEALACAKAGIPFEVVPGVSAVTAVPTYAGVPLTCATSTAVHVMGMSGAVDHACTDPNATVVAVGNTDVLMRGLGALLEAGRAADTPVALTQCGTSVAQVTATTTLGEVASALRTVQGPALAVVGPTVAMRDALSWFETKPLFGWNVLVPRTKEQSGSIVSRLAAYGAVATIVPTINVEPPRTPQQMDRAITGLVTGRYEWIGFTSVNAVKAIRERLEALGLDARSFAGLKIAAVGGVTAKALLAWGLNPDLVPSGEQSARGLLEEWPPFDDILDPINRVLLPRADIATDTLVAGLLDMGWEVDDVTAYRTVRAAPPAPEVRDAIKGGAFDAVVFTSSSTVRNLVGIAGKPHATTVVACIGPATAKTAQEHGLRVDVLAATPAADVLIDALADYGAARAHAAAQAGEPVRRPSQRRPATRRRARS